MSLKEISDKLGTNKDNAYDVLTRIEDILEAQESRAEKADRGKMRDLEKQIEAAQKKQRSGGTSSSANGVTYSSPSGILSGGGFGLGAAAAGLGGLAKGAGALGAGLAAFFVGLAAAEGIMSKFGNGENLKALLTNLAEGLGAFNSESLLALGGLFAAGALFGMVPGGAKGNMLGIAALGAGLAAFFVEFSAADALIEKYGGDGSSITAVVKNIGDAVSSLVSSGNATALAGLFAVGGLLGALPNGVKTTAKSAIGIAAIGAGIAAFFTAISAGDYAISQMQSDGTAIAAVVGSIGGVIKDLVDSGTGAGFAGLFAAGAIFGAFTGTGTKLKATIGIAAIGAGIAAFFTALAGGDVAISAMQATGESFKTLAGNIVEGIGVFTGESAAVILGLIATGGIFGPAMIGASVGMGAIGAGIGFFFAGLAAGDTMITAMNKLAGAEPGEGFKKLLINTADGVERFANIDVDPNKVSGLAGALNSVSLAMVGFFSADAFGKMKSIFDAGVEGVAGVIDFFFGSNIQGEYKKGPIERIIDGMKPIQSISETDIEKMDLFAAALDRLFNSFNQFQTLRVDQAFSAKIVQSLKGIGVFLDVLPNMIKGGTWTGTKWGVSDNIPFGSGLENLREEDLSLVKEGISKVYEALGVTGPSPAISAEAFAPITDALKGVSSSIAAFDASVQNINITKQAPRQVAPAVQQNNNAYPY